jgi:hypothetical protein
MKGRSLCPTTAPTQTALFCSASAARRCFPAGPASVLLLPPRRALWTRRKKVAARINVAGSDRERRSLSTKKEAASDNVSSIYADLSRSAGSCPALVDAAYARLLVRAVRRSKPASPGPPPLSICHAGCGYFVKRNLRIPHVLLSPVRACCAPVSSTKSSAHGTARHATTHPGPAGGGPRVRASSSRFAARSVPHYVAWPRVAVAAVPNYLLGPMGMGGGLLRACMHACRSSSIIGG